MAEQRDFEDIKVKFMRKQKLGLYICCALCMGDTHKKHKYKDTCVDSFWKLFKILRMWCLPKISNALFRECFSSAFCYGNFCDSQ